MLLGIDVGTTGTKTTLLSTNGDILASGYESYDLITERKGYVEQDPEAWWNAIVRTVNNCVNNYDIKKIKAVSLSLQSGTLVCVDKNGNPITNAISWLDTRAGEEAEELKNEYGNDYIYERTGWPISNCFNMIQILHMKKNNPDVFRKTYKFMCVSDYLYHKLTGKYVTDNNSIQNSQLCDLTTGFWNDDIVRISGADQGRLCTIVDSGKIIGRLLPEIADQLGLSKETVLVAGGQDQYCSAIGIGAIHKDEIMFSTGTSWVVLGIADHKILDYKNGLISGRHIIPGLYTGFAYTPAGGAAMKWYRDNMAAVSAGAKDNYDNITKRAGNIEVGSEGLFFLPHFAGTLYPTWNENSRGILWGLDLMHNRDHVARALMEGVAFDLTWIIENMKDVGYTAKKMKCLGGSTRSDVWMQMVADMTNLEMVVSQEADVAPIGAALIAGVGVGTYKNYEEACRVLKKTNRSFYPNRERHEAYKVLFKKYKKLFDAQKMASKQI